MIFNVSAPTSALGIFLSIGTTGSLKADDLSSVAGTWAFTKADCKLSVPTYDDRFRISRNGKNGSAESSCESTDVKVIGGSISLSNVCVSEDIRSRTNVKVTILSPGKIRWAESGRPVIDYVLCSLEKPADQTKNINKPTTNSSFSAGSFMLSSHGYSATISSISNIDSAFAVMFGKVTPSDAEEECERNSPGGDGLKPKALKACVSKTMAETANVIYKAAADCKKRTIVPSFGARYSIAGIDQSGSFKILDGKGRDIGSTTASGAPAIEDQFKRLCPGSVRKLGVKN